MNEEWEKWIRRIIAEDLEGDELPENLRSDEAFLLVATEKAFWAAKYARDSLKNDKEFVRKTVSINGLALQVFPEYWRDDRDIALSACASNGWALEFISDEFRADPEIVWAAIRQNGGALAYAADAFKSDPDVILTAVKTYGTALCMAPEALRKDRKFVMTAVKHDGMALGSAPTFWKDREIVLEAARSNGYSLTSFAWEGFLSDKEIVLAAIKDSLIAYDCASDELQHAPDVIRAYRESLIQHAEESAEAERFNEWEYTLLIGKTAHDTEVNKTASEITSLLIAGRVGSGKSTFLHQIIRQIIEKYPADEAELVLLDPKAVEFAKYRDDSHLRLPIVTNKDVAIDTLEELTYGSPFAPVFVFIDEYAEWALADTRFRNAVTELAKVGKKRNVYLFAATQCDRPDILSKDFLGAFDHIGAFKVCDKSASRRLIGDAGAEQLAPGEMVLFDKSSGNTLCRLTANA